MELVLMKVLLLILFVMLFFLYRRVRVLTASYQTFMQGRNGANMEETLQSISENVRSFASRLDRDRARLEDLASVLDTTIRGVGIVRFNAFQNTGGDLSFSVACLDARQNGLVFSNIYGREESRTYAKPVREGRSPYQLSGEEQEAIRRAVAATQQLAAHSR